MSNKNKKISPLKDSGHGADNNLGHIHTGNEVYTDGSGGNSGNDPNDPLTITEQMQNNPDYLMETGAANTQQQLQDNIAAQTAAQSQVDITRGEFDDFQFQNFFENLENPYAGIQTDFENLGAGYENVTAGMSNVTEGMTNVYAGAKNVYAGAKNTFAGMENAFSGLENQFAGMENAYAGLENQYEGMENRYEDMTVDTRAADFAAQQGQQQRANIMQGLRGAAGSSGVAGLAQAMASQGQLAAQQQAAGIGQQERQNKMMAAQEGSRIDMTQRGEASRLASQAAAGTMQNQAMMRQGAAQLQSQQAQATMANQMAERQGEMTAQQMRMQGAAQQQQMILGGAQTLQSQQIAAAQSLQGIEAQSAMQNQQMEFQGATNAEQNAIAQNNLIAQGAWATDIASAQGAMDVQGMEFGQLSTQLGMDYAMLAGANEAVQMGYSNELAYAGLEQGVNMQNSANQQSGQNAMMGLIGTGVKLWVTNGAACIPKGTNIDCIDSVTAIENIKPGDIIIGYSGKPVKVLQKHEYLEDVISKFYKVKFKGENGETPEVNVSHGHKIMGEPSDQITENVVSKEVYGGVEFSYDLLTEDLGYRMNGIPVNSMIGEYMTGQKESTLS